jgi:hypothetical protein
MEYVSRCPSCSALVRPGQDWCTLCHADLRPPELRPTAVAPVLSEVAVEPAVEHADPLEAPLDLLLADPDAPADLPSGKHARHAAVPAAPAALTSDGAVAPSQSESPVDPVQLAEFMARLAAESADTSLGGFAGRLPQTQNMRMVLALGVGVGTALVLVFGAWLLGLVFG